MVPLILLAAAAGAQNFEAVAAAPASHTILFENEKVRVLRVVVAPGQTEPVHEHCWPSIMYFQQPQPITYMAYELRDGVPVAIATVDAPAAEANHTESIGPEDLHAIRNRGDQPFIAVRMEFKEGSCRTR